MRKRSWYQRFALAALALFLTVCQPYTALAAEPQEVRGAAALSVERYETPTPEGFMARLSLHTDNGRPQKDTTRAQYVTLLYESMGSPEMAAEQFYLDVPEESDYAVAVTWAHRTGILERDGGYFRPDDYITQVEAQALLARALSALRSSVQQMANSILAAYTGRTDEEDQALTPGALLAVLDDILSESRQTVEYPAALSSGPPDRGQLNPSAPPLLESAP